jgi:hypothetical protein
MTDWHGLDCKSVCLLPTLVGVVCVCHGQITSHERKATCKGIDLRALALIKGLQIARDDRPALIGASELQRHELTLGRLIASIL